MTSGYVVILSLISLVGIYLVLTRYENLQRQQKTVGMSQHSPQPLQSSF
jgi:hypothetical protein